MLLFQHFFQIGFYWAYYWNFISRNCSRNDVEKQKTLTKLSLSTMVCGIPHGVAQQVLKNACAKYVCVVIH